MYVQARQTAPDATISHSEEHHCGLGRGPDGAESGGSGNTVNRLNSGRSPGGLKGCLAAETAGWTAEGMTRCRVGYSYGALTAQEAYETYGVAPYASAIIAAAAPLGVLLEESIDR